ncbi:MAG TPA: hypothetical protein VFW71_05575 [Actinomycetota bacterium]|nr:hypothetical protein [Actinomycetota bacterium]
MDGPDGRPTGEEPAVEPAADAADGAALATNGEEPGAAVGPVRSRPPGLAGRTRHRGILWAGVTVIILFVGALLFAILGSRGNADAVPGADPVASLAVIRAGYLVGTTGGLAVSPDGRTWSVAHLPAELVAVAANDGSTAYVLAGGLVHTTTDLKTYTDVASGATGTVIAAHERGVVIVGQGNRVMRVGVDGIVEDLLPGRSEPSGLRALAASSTDANTFLAGGPVSGLWETTDGATTWHQLLRTPIQAILMDVANPKRFFVGTDGGILVSTDGGRSWTFTSFRLNTEGLAQDGGRIYAIASDRVIYSSPDGVTGWAPVVSG